MVKKESNLKEIYDHLFNIEDEEIRNKYSDIILTLLEKGYFPGLAGIPVVKSRVSYVDGEKGELTYRGYRVQELAEKCSYEDVCFLLLNEDLPLPEEQKKLREQFINNKDVGKAVARSIVTMDDNLHPMNMLSAGVLLLQTLDDNPHEVENYKQNLHKSINLIAKFPSLLGIFRSKDPDFARGKEFGSFAEYALHCFNPEMAEKEECVEIFEEMLILHADHTMNNSTFSARAVGSSQASIYASISSAINSLSGPLHGGANERVILMLEKIESPDKVEEYVERKLKNKEKIMGIGHRVYKTYDPRAIYIKENILPQIYGEDNQEKILDIDSELMDLYQKAKILEKVAIDRLGSKKLYPNVDFWSGLVLKALGIKPSYFTTIFALGRIMGWCSHYVEHMEVTSRIYRPTQLYDGFKPRKVLISPSKIKED